MYLEPKHFKDNAQLPIFRDGLRTISPTKEIANLLLKYHNKKEYAPKHPFLWLKTLNFLKVYHVCYIGVMFKWNYPVSKERKHCTSTQH